MEAETMSSDVILIADGNPARGQRVATALESADPETLEAIGKPVSARRVVGAFEKRPRELSLVVAYCY